MFTITFRDDFTVVLQPSLVNGELPKRYYW